MLEPRLPPPELLPVLMAKTTRARVLRALARGARVTLQHQTASAQGVIRAMVRDGLVQVDEHGQTHLIPTPEGTPR